jgi:hypothetical protein
MAHRTDPNVWRMDRFFRLDFSVQKVAQKWPSRFFNKKANECNSLAVSGCPGWDRTSDQVINSL